VRRRWPQLLVSWTRVLSGEWHDPLVGRDALVGCAAGCLLAGLSAPLAGASSAEVQATDSNLLDGVLGVATFVSRFFGSFPGEAVATTLGLLLFLVLMRIIVRKDWAAAAAGVIILLLPAIFNSPAEERWIQVLGNLVALSLAVFVLARFGVIAAVSMLVVL